MAERRIEIDCPECGAPLPPSAASSAVVCAQCGTTSQPAPRGPEKIVQTIVVERVVVRDGAAGAAATVPCPRCKIGLFAVKAKDITVQGCGVCGGIWLDNAGSVAITQHVDPQIGVLAARADMNAAMHTRPGDEKLDCPVCHEQMRRVNAAKLAELDVCATHGTWFDPGELRRVMSAYHSKDDDPLAPIEGKRDLAEQELAALAAATAPPPDPWTFEGPTASRIVDGGIDILGALLSSAARR